MFGRRTAAPPTGPNRKPRDDEIDVYGLTHVGKVRKENQDHFLVCSLKKQMLVHETSLPQTEHLLVGPERFAFLMMVADGVGGAARGADASRLALEAATQYVAHSTRCYYAASMQSDEEFTEALRKRRSLATRSSCARARATPSAAAWRLRSRYSWERGPGPTCFRWVTAAVICFARAS